MFEELIEKIKELCLPDTEPFAYMVNGTIQDVVDIIKSFEPQPKDALIIIDEIEALKTKGNFTNGCIYNRAIDDVLKLIESYKPKVLDETEPQDKPDSEGWWWFIGTIMGKQAECYIQVSEQSWGTAYMRVGAYSIHNGHLNNLSYVKGKWYKAIVPEGQK